MARFLTTKGITSEISEVISHAEKRIVLISPYVKIAGYFQDKLRAASQRGIRIIVVCRHKDLAEEQKRMLLSIPGLQLFTHDNVHAKCYYNERTLVLGSLNLYEYSDQNNREMGISMNAASDAQLFQDATREAEEIIQMASRKGGAKPQTKAPGSSAIKVQWKKPATSLLEKITDVFSHRGFCIRCHDELNLNPNVPFCHDCYTVWAQWENPDFEEKFCHSCGKKHASSRRRPLCLECFRKGSF
jgi:phosphatidylserine/phosphatidylglycerophosphate/cardiolipin synthase-like enzyme